MNPAYCPLCSRPNDCQLCTTVAYKGPCWCTKLEIPDALLAQVPSEFRNKNCICHNCVMEFHWRGKSIFAQKVLPGDFYFAANGQIVFTAAYHLRRGYCCGSGCRHCPFEGKNFTRM